MNGRNLRLDPQLGIDSAAALVFGQLSYVVIRIMRQTFRYSGLSEMARRHLLFLPEQSRLLRSKNSATYIPDGAPADAKRRALARSALTPNSPSTAPPAAGETSARPLLSAPRVFPRHTL